MTGAPADLSDGRSRPGRTMNRTAVASAFVAGLAWMTGFVLFLAIWVKTVVQTGDASGMLLGFFMYGAWALALGVLLLRRPSRAIFAVSLAFAAFLLVLMGRSQRRDCRFRTCPGSLTCLTSQPPWPHRLVS